MSEKSCCECGAYLTEGSEHVFEERVMCEDCFHRLTVVCEYCGDRIWNAFRITHNKEIAVFKFLLEL